MSMRSLSKGAPAWLYICNQAKAYKCPSRIRIRTFLLRLQVNLRVLILVHLHNGPDPVLLIRGYPKVIPMSVAPETLRELQTRVESPNFNL
jgi:hypothetical protein